MSHASAINNALTRVISQKYSVECMNNAYLGGVACGILVTAGLFLFQRKTRPVKGM